MTDEQLFATYFAALVAGGQEIDSTAISNEQKLLYLMGKVSLMMKLHRDRYPFKADPTLSLFGQVFGNRS